eukprot:g6210.t1
MSQRILILRVEYMTACLVQRHAAAQEKDDNADVDVCDSTNAFTDHDSGHDSDRDIDDHRDLDAGDLEQQVRLAWLQQQVEDNLREGA